MHKTVIGVSRRNKSLKHNKATASRRVGSRVRPGHFFLLWIYKCKLHQPTVTADAQKLMLVRAIATVHVQNTT